MRRPSRYFHQSRNPVFIPQKFDRNRRPIFSTRQILSADKLTVGMIVRLHSAGRRTRTAVVMSVSAEKVDLYLVEEKNNTAWHLSGLSVAKEEDGGWNRYHYLTRTDKPILTEAELESLN